MNYKKIKSGYQTRIWLGERPSRKQVKVSASTVKELKERIQIVKDEYKLSQGLFEPEVTFIEYAKQWLPIHAQTNQLAVKTIEGYAHHINGILSDSSIANKKLFEIKTRDVRAFHNELLEKFSNQYVRNIHSTCRVIFSTAVVEERVMSNPFVITKAPKIDKLNKNSSEVPRERIIDKALIDKIISKAKDNIKVNDNSQYFKFVAESTYASLLVSYLLGLRPAEIGGIKWSDLKTDNFGTHTLSIERATTIERLGEDSKCSTQTILKGTKTGRSRKLTIGSAFIKILRDYRKQSLKHFEDPRFNNGLNLMFPTPDGEIMSPKVLSQRFKTILKDITDNEIQRKHVLYDFRHTHASLLLSDGWDIVSVANRLGHSTPQTTLNIYAHFIPNRDSSRVESFENSLLGNNF